MENSFYNSLLHDESFDTCLFFGISFIFQFLCVSDLLFSSSKCFIQKLLFFLSNDSLKGSSGRVHFTWLLLKLQGQCLARRQLTVDISLTGANTARLCFYATSKARSQNKNRGGKKAFRRLPWANRVKHSSYLSFPWRVPAGNAKLKPDQSSVFANTGLFLTSLCFELRRTKFGSQMRQRLAITTAVN